jgi:Effector Associated Constant Component 1
MAVRISIVGGDQAQLESLDEWLRREYELAGRVAFAVTKPREGELGALGEALVVAVSSGGTLSVLGASLKAWISLPRHSDVRIKVHGPDGRAVEISADRINDERIDELIRQALSFGIPEE